MFGGLTVSFSNAVSGSVSGCVPAYGPSQLQEHCPAAGEVDYFLVEMGFRQVLEISGDCAEHCPLWRLGRQWLVQVRRGSTHGLYTWLLGELRPVKLGQAAAFRRSGCGPLIFEPTRDCCTHFATSRATWRIFEQWNWAGKDMEEVHSSICHFFHVHWEFTCSRRFLALTRCVCSVSGSSHWGHVQDIHHEIRRVQSGS